LVLRNTKKIFHHSFSIDTLEFVDADAYGTDHSNSQKKKQPMNMAKIVKEADDEIRRVILIARQRQLALSPLMAHEFSPSSLALCDSHNVNLINQQPKAVVIGLIRELYPSAFHSSYPVSTVNSALVIDGGSLLETKPLSTSRTIGDYAEQLLTGIIGNMFKTHVSHSSVLKRHRVDRMKLVAKRSKCSPNVTTMTRMSVAIN
jgi:hypothetical protein